MPSLRVANKSFFIGVISIRLYGTSDQNPPRGDFFFPTYVMRARAWASFDFEFRSSRDSRPAHVSDKKGAAVISVGGDAPIDCPMRIQAILAPDVIEFAAFDPQRAYFNLLTPGFSWPPSAILPNPDYLQSDG